MNTKFKVALVLFVIALVLMIFIGYHLRGEFGIGTEILVPVIGILYWIYYDNKKQKGEV